MKGIGKWMNKKTDSIIKCDVCAHLLMKEDIKVVEFSGTDKVTNFPLYAHFCPEHAPKYDYVLNNRYYKTIPQHDIEVDKNGKPIKKHDKTTTL